MTRDQVTSYNTGLRIHVTARVHDAKLPALPTSTDLAKAREHLLRAIDDINGLLIYLPAQDPAKA